MDNPATTTTEHKNPETSGATTPPRFGTELTVAFAVLLLVFAVVTLWHPTQPQPVAEASAITINFNAPDALIESTSLSSLPRDLLKVPLLNDALSEDVVFYYEHNADRLGLIGSLRRIAYEHELEFSDSVIQEILDAPANVALWRDDRNKLTYSAAIIHRGILARLLEPLARAASSDRQLSEAGTIEVDGDIVSLYKLHYLPEKTLLFASHGDRLLVLSDAGMLLSDGENSAPGRLASEQVAKLLENDGTMARSFQMKSMSGKHRITLGGDLLTLGYHRFLPALSALSFAMTFNGQWSGALAMTGHNADAALWRSIPLGASACVALPVDHDALHPILAKLGGASGHVNSLEQALGDIAICWYGKSRLHAPLIISHLRGDSAGIDNVLAQLFDAHVGAEEAARENQSRFPVKETRRGGATLWQREVGSSFGTYAASDSTTPDELASERFFQVTLAHHGEYLLFSLDDRLVLDGLATLDKHFPPLADALPASANTLAYIAPKGLASLLEKETWESLPADMEPVFRNAAEAHLLPKLHAMAGHDAYSLNTSDTSQADGIHWSALSFSTVR